MAKRKWCKICLEDDKVKVPCLEREDICQECLDNETQGESYGLYHE